MRTAPLANRGFTLIELMIVVVIIGILATIAVPRFVVTSWEAKEKEADTFLKQVYEIQTGYRVHNGTHATDLAQLQSAGLDAPTLQYYSLPAPAGGYEFPICLQSTGAWADRQVDADGRLSDC